MTEPAHVRLQEETDVSGYVLPVNVESGKYRPSPVQVQAVIVCAACAVVGAAVIIGLTVAGYYNNNPGDPMEGEISSTELGLSAALGAHEFVVAAERVGIDLPNDCDELPWENTEQIAFSWHIHY